MGTLIHKVGHGLVANDTIMLGNLVGGDGLEENTVYYVLAAGLTANDFAVSESSGGVAIVFTTNITSGVIVRTDTYQPVNDGIMDQPSALGDPGQPVLTSDIVTGTVRVVVTIPSVAVNPRIRHTEFQITDEYTVPASAPTGPIYTNATTQQLLPGTTTFSVRVHPLTTYSARIRNVDVYGNASAWSVASLGPSASIVTIDGLDSLVSASLDHQIGTVEIADGAITADLLEATMVLSSQIVAGPLASQHVEMDLDGIRLVDASHATVVNIPTDSAQPVSVQGNVVAGTLVSTTSAEFRTAASLPTGAVLTAQGSVGAPTAAPVLSSGYEAIVSSGESPNDWGLCWDGTYLCRVRMVDTGTVKIDRYTTAGVLNNTITTDYAPGAVNALINGLAWDGTNFWLLFTNSPATTVSLKKFNSAGVTQSTTAITADITGTKGQVGGLFYDGTTSRLVVCTTVGTGAGTHVRFRLYNIAAAPVLSSTVDATGDSVSGSLTSITGAARNGTEYWVQMFGSGTNGQATWAFTAATGALVANTDWGYTTAGASAAGAGVTWDGTNFYFRSTKIYKATNWTWTVASSKYWVGYTWMDDAATIVTGATAAAATDLVSKASHGLVAGNRVQFTTLTGGTGLSLATDYWVIATGLTASVFSVSATPGGAAVNITVDYSTVQYRPMYETVIGPRASITMYRRMRLSITNAAIPTGGVNDPDKVRVYMKPNATDPGAAAFFLQNTDALTQRYLITYTSAGTADGLGPAFPSGTPATIKSSAGDWVLKGSGFINRVGTAFPANPVTNDQYWRSDLGAEFYYDGTRWLSVLVYSKTLPAGSTTSFAATTSNLAWAPFGLILGASDLWLLEFDAMFFVNTGGTALGASHSWALSLDKAVANNTTFTTLGTVTINSGVNGSRSGSAAINALLNNGTVHAGMRINATKVGTPGAIFCGGEVFYRLVAV